MGTMSLKLGPMGFQEQVVTSYPIVMIILSYNKKLTLTGRHCCLWCNISTTDMALAPSSRGPVTLRTSATLESDLARFNADGGNIEKAKLFNNVIRESLFPISLDKAGLLV